jgi:hypothetical protein
MQRAKPSVRQVLAAAVLIMAAIFAWRVSGSANTLLHDFHIHLVASVPHQSTPHPKVVPAPPKLIPISCQ